MNATVAQIDVREALATANKFARKIAGRWDDEIESAANFAVAVALDKWDGERNFKTFLHRCVLLELKTLMRGNARRRERETTFTDLDIE